MVRKESAGGGFSHRESVANGSGGRTAMAFAVGALLVSVVALAFSVGRHFPIPAAAEDERAKVPSGPLEEIKTYGAIAYDRLEVDRGGAHARDAVRNASRGDADDH